MCGIHLEVAKSSSGPTVAPLRPRQVEAFCCKRNSRVLHVPSDLWPSVALIPVQRCSDSADYESFNYWSDGFTTPLSLQPETCQRVIILLEGCRGWGARVTFVTYVERFNKANAARTLVFPLLELN